MISETPTVKQFVRVVARTHGDSLILVYDDYAVPFPLEARDEALRIAHECAKDVRDTLRQRCTKRLNQRTPCLRAGTLSKDEVQHHHFDLLMLWAMQRVDASA